jgi:hypothetical protein
MRDYYILLQKFELKPSEMKIDEYINTPPLFKDIWNSDKYNNQTTLELLAIILPEQYGIEIDRCIPGSHIPYNILEVLLKSFQWRNNIKDAQNMGIWLVEISKDKPDFKAWIIDGIITYCCRTESSFLIGILYTAISLCKKVWDSWIYGGHLILTKNTKIMKIMFINVLLDGVG